MAYKTDDALKNGFEVVLISDCIGTGNPKQQLKTAMFEELKLQGAKVHYQSN